MIAVAFLGW